MGFSYRFPLLDMILTDDLDLVDDLDDSVQTGNCPLGELLVAETRHAPAEDQHALVALKG